MRCKKHLSDLSSSVGVCASCLRERLFALIAAQAQAQAQAQGQARAHVQQQLFHEDHRKSDSNPPPLVFPRSVSPYISRRKSDTTPWQFQHNSLPSIPDQRFYSTPQVGPNGTVIAAGHEPYKKKGYFRFFSGLFRSKTEKLDSDPRVSNFGDAYQASSSSPSWFTTILSGRRKKQSRTFSVEESTIGGHRRTCRNRDRGMSPARYSDDEEDEHCNGGSSGYSSESSKLTPRRTPAAQHSRRGKSSHNRNFSGMAFCLSPLVRASPSRNWNQKGMPPEMIFSGEIRVPAKPQLSTATSFCKNRSRKLADFGRFNPNH